MTRERMHTVYLVDDSAPVRERLKELLGLEPDVAIVGEADTAASAIRGILGTRPDFVVLDYRLAEGTGLEVLCAAVDAAPGTVFIVLTNHASAHLRSACTAAGARFFLDKSIEFGRLPGIIAGPRAMHP